TYTLCCTRWVLSAVILRPAAESATWAAGFLSWPTASFRRAIPPATALTEASHSRRLLPWGFGDGCIGPSISFFVSYGWPGRARHRNKLESPWQPGTESQREAAGPMNRFLKYLLVVLGTAPAGCLPVHSDSSAWEGVHENVRRSPGSPASY